MSFDLRWNIECWFGLWFCSNISDISIKKCTLHYKWFNGVQLSWGQIKISDFLKKLGLKDPCEIFFAGALNDNTLTRGEKWILFNRCWLFYIGNELRQKCWQIVVHGCFNCKPNLNNSNTHLPACQKIIDQQYHISHQLYHLITS